MVAAVLWMAAPCRRRGGSGGRRPYGPPSRRRRRRSRQGSAAPSDVAVPLTVRQSGRRGTRRLVLAIHVVLPVLTGDLAGGRAAARLGVPVIGSAGALLLANRRARIDLVRPTLDALLHGGLRLSTRLDRDKKARRGIERPGAAVSVTRSGRGKRPPRWSPRRLFGLDRPTSTASGWPSGVGGRPAPSLWTSSASRTRSGIAPISRRPAFTQSVQRADLRTAGELGKGAVHVERDTDDAQDAMGSIPHVGRREEQAGRGGGGWGRVRLVNISSSDWAVGREVVRLPRMWRISPEASTAFDHGVDKARDDENVRQSFKAVATVDEHGVAPKWGS